MRTQRHIIWFKFRRFQENWKFLYFKLCGDNLLLDINKKLQTPVTYLIQFARMMTHAVCQSKRKIQISDEQHATMATEHSLKYSRQMLTGHALNLMVFPTTAAIDENINTIMWLGFSGVAVQALFAMFQRLL